MSGAKQYGLQIPKKANHSLLLKTSVFGEDSDSDKSEKGGTDWVKKSLKRPTDKSAPKKQTKLDLQRALEQDPTVFQYDEVYDQLEQKKQDSFQSKSKEKKPRYIQQLLNTAERRKIENERRIERQVQKEREAEGEEFRDKETFVTSAYKKKLEEFAKLDEEQKRQDMLEDIGDVTKQQDISGFYRHLYQSTVGGKDENVKNLEKDQKEKSPEKNKISKEINKDTRHYRKRKNSGSSEDKNKDEDSEKSSSSSSNSESESDGDKSSEVENESTKKVVTKEKDDSEKQNIVDTSSKTVVENKIIKSKSPERSIWEKRTIGQSFDEALKRYLERKSAKLAVVH